MTALLSRAALVLSLSAVPALANDQAIVVFDASGSMWGQIGGKAKIEIARDTLKSVLSTLPADLDLGLMVYGHRDKGSCQDIELMVPPGPGNAGAINAAVAGLRPKGKTPISASVRQAAEALKYTEDKATVILVTDGLETCDADPCALADELEKSGVDFTAHVVGFGLSRDDGKKIACLADRTGGKYFSADDATSLSAALTATVKAAAEPAPAPAKEPDPAVVADHLFEGTAMLAEGGEPFIGDDLYWELRQPDMADGSHGETVDYTYGGTFKPKVDKAGDYVAEARLGEVTIDIPVTLKAGEVFKQDFVLNAGIVRPTASRTEGGEPDADASLTVVHSGGETNSYGHPTFFVPAGQITVKARIGSAEVERSLDLKAGESIDLPLVAASGVMWPNALYKAGGPAVEGNDIHFEILKPEVDINGNRTVIDSGYGSGSAYDLSAGDYVLSARLDAVTAEAPFTVKAGQKTDVTLVLDAGVVGVKATDVYKTDIVGAKLSIEGKRTAFNSSYDATYNFTLPPGDYILVVYLDDTMDSLKEVPFTVKAGERTEVTATK